MADKKADPKPAAAPEAPTKGRLPLKTIAVVLVLMVAEAAGVVFVLGLTGPAKSEAHTDAAKLASDEAEQTREILITEDKFQNLQTGKVWLWDVAVYAQVKNKNAAAIEKGLDRRSAEIQEGISQIFSRAQHAQLKEPDRQTLNRQLTSYFREVFATSEGAPLVEKVLIPKCRGFPADV